MTRREFSKLTSALPFWASLILAPLAWIAAIQGGLWIAVVPITIMFLFPLVDAMTGLNTDNPDLETPDEDLKWYRLVTLIWPPIQFVTIFGILFLVTRQGYMSGVDQWLLFCAIGTMTGTVGINFSHELMHQKPKIERHAADFLLAQVLYSHFRSEHLLVHHRYVATPKDAVTARYNEGFHRFFFRVLMECGPSAFDAEKKMLERKGLRWSDLSNPFWKYWVLQLIMLAIAFSIAGFWGVFLFAAQAFTAILYLELVNYIEHYGLTRKHLGDGKYEHVLPRHSWNASHKASNWLLINLQRHSDHHYKPNRRFPLLQTYDKDDAPQLPYGYPLLGIAALIPPVWRRMMNPKVRAWRKKYYPEIEDWSAYKTASNPMPR